MHRVVFYSDIIESCNNNIPIRNLPRDVTLEAFFKSGMKTPTFKILHYHNEVIVYFAGTRLSSNDISIDLKFNQAHFLGGYCHKGYLKASLAALLILDPYLHGAKEITFIGHSLGGACAAICAAILRIDRGMENVKAFTLACPGIFSPLVVSKTKGFITTFIRENDPIPRIFNLKRSAYALKNSFNKIKHYSADSVPGRVLVLTKTQENEIIVRKAIPRDFILTSNILTKFSEHDQRAYLSDITAIYGNYSDSSLNFIVQLHPKHIYSISNSVHNWMFGRRVLSGIKKIKFGTNVFWKSLSKAYRACISNPLKIEGGNEIDFSEEELAELPENEVQHEAPGPHGPLHRHHQRNATI